MSDILTKEIFRKSIHLSGMLIPAIYYFIDRFTAVFWLSLIVVVMIQLEWMRLRGYVKYPGILLRSFENRKVAGYVYSTIAALIVIALFSKTIAIVAFTMFVIGDACSGIAGAVWGEKVNVRHLKLPIKPVPILLMMFLVSFISGYSVTLTPRLEQLPAFVIAVGALGATLADGVPWQIRGRMLDDNLTIPLVSALLIFLFSSFSR